MNAFGVNFLLAVVWVVLTGSTTLTGLLTGFVLGFGVLWMVQPLTGERLYFRRVFAWVSPAWPSPGTS
jgi:multicomponent Na+:H+ antiporter subunit E